MTSTSIYKLKYCVYHITYKGNMMPQNYIGSTSTKQVEERKYKLFNETTN